MARNTSPEQAEQTEQKIKREHVATPTFSLGVAAERPARVGGAGRRPETNPFEDAAQQIANDPNLTLAVTVDVPADDADGKSVAKVVRLIQTATRKLGKTARVSVDGPTVTFWAVDQIKRPRKTETDSPEPQPES